MTDTASTDACDDLVRLKILELRRTSESQAELILEMAAAGFTNSRIAELVGTTPDTVRSAVHRDAARKKRTKP